MSYWMRVAILIALCISLLAPAEAQAQDAPAAPETPEAILETPQTLIDDPIISYAIVSPKIFWSSMYMVNCDPDSHSKTIDDAIQRVAVQGSITRTLYLERTEGDFCIPTITSNIVSEGSYIYFVRNGSFQRLSVLANPGDAAQSLALVNLGTGHAELLRRDPFIYVLTEANGFWRVNHDTFTAVQLLTAVQAGASPTNLQTDGEFLYWLSGGRLKHAKLSNITNITTFAPLNVTNYTLRTDPGCLFEPCDPAALVYIGVGNKIDRYISETRAFDKNIITSPAADDRFDEMVVSNDMLFYVQEEQTTCEPFCSYNTLLKRVSFTGSGTPELIYQGGSNLLGNHTVLNLRAFGGNLYWVDTSGNQARLLRLAEDADALPLTNLRITKIEITQAIQDLNNSVRVIEGKRTFVRVHVRSDGPAVNGITVLLHRLNIPGGTPVGEPLRPLNPSGQYLTVRPDPDRAVLDQAFLFELPMEWVTGAVVDLIGLGLQAEVNPYKFPAQASYANNIVKVAKQFSPSGRLDIRFVLFRYVVDDVEFVPDVDVDFFQTVSWIRRAYPLASEPGFIGGTSPGFKPGYTTVTDNALKDYITQKECDFDDSLCASDYVHGLLEDWDEEWNFPDAPMYGMMPYYTSPYDGQGYFPRGSASGDTANGPSGAPGGDWNWDLDGTYADWYAGHEIAHVLDRDHPTPNSDDDPDDSTPKGCGHTDDDDDFPYAGARIGVGDLYGFDMGNPENPAVAIPSVYPPNGAFDMMSYCHPIQWISDYTYDGLYEEIVDLAAAQPAATGDYFYLYGVIKPADEAGKFVRVRRKSGDYTPPPAAASDYAIRFRDASNGELGAVDIPATVDEDDASRLLFNVELALLPGTRTIELVHKPDNQVYITKTVSANAPVVNTVSIGQPGNPVSGTLTLAWSAADADGDPLSFDVHYSRDNGVNFQPIQAGLTGSSVQIDTLELGGSTQALFRVTASDGSNTGSKVTEPFTLANKPPVVTIDNPMNGTQIHYGQLINFMGSAYDPQWEAFAPVDLTWASEDGPLGTGSMLTVDLLPVGEHTITFTAKNAAGLSSSASISVTVDDDLDITQATLAVAPTQLGWHFAISDTAPQTATLVIANVGGGTLGWTATTADPWLSLSAAGGSAPSHIIVTADPAQIPQGESISGSILVTGTVAAGSLIVGTANVPAHAVFGNGYVQPSGGPEVIPLDVELYLPTLQDQSQ